LYQDAANRIFVNDEVFTGEPGVMPWAGEQNLGSTYRHGVGVTQTTACFINPLAGLENIPQELESPGLGCPFKTCLWNTL